MLCFLCRYRRVLRACALGADIDILPDKDRTELGDKVGYSKKLLLLSVIILLIIVIIVGIIRTMVMVMPSWPSCCESSLWLCDEC